MTLFHALLLERKVVLVQENFADNAVLIESLLSLLKPLQCACVTIPYLHEKMTEFIEAPVPYIIGVSRKIWSECCVTRSEELAADVIVFEMDRD